MTREGEVNELNIVLKADVSGSLEALQDEIAKLPQDEIAVNVIRAAAGGITFAGAALVLNVITVGVAILLKYQFAEMKSTLSEAIRSGFIQIRIA